MPRRGILRKPAKRRKKTPLSKLKKRVEALQKELVIKLYGTDCYTCPQKNLIGANRQLGHVPWPRSILSNHCKFLTDFARIQCFSCNIHRGGMGAIAFKRMVLEGVDVEAMWQLNEKTKGKVCPTIFFEQKIATYELKLLALVKV